MRPTHPPTPHAWASARLRMRRGELPREREDAEAARQAREPDEIFQPLEAGPPEGGAIRAADEEPLPS